MGVSGTVILVQEIELAYNLSFDSGFLYSSQTSSFLKGMNLYISFMFYLITRTPFHVMAINGE